jgi:hypothetical protein
LCDFIICDIIFRLLSASLTASSLLLFSKDKL